MVEHRGFALGCGLGQGAALRLHWSLIHYRTRSNPLLLQKTNKKATRMGGLLFGGA